MLFEKSMRVVPSRSVRRHPSPKCSVGGMRLAQNGVATHPTRQDALGTLEEFGAV